MGFGVQIIPWTKEYGENWEKIFRKKGSDTKGGREDENRKQKGKSG